MTVFLSVTNFTAERQMTLCYKVDTVQQRYLRRIKWISIWYDDVKNECRICIRCIRRTTDFAPQLHEAIVFQLQTNVALSYLAHKYNFKVSQMSTSKPPTHCVC